MISVNYSYYNNLETFKLVRDHYINCSNYNDYKFRIVDDGSQHKPLPESEVPGEWDHYVVENDVQKNLNIVDLTGAGDLFAAGFLHGYINKLSTKECLEKGTEMSSKVIQQIGARI